MDLDDQSLSRKDKGHPHQEVGPNTEPQRDDKLWTPPTSKREKGQADDNYPKKAPITTQIYSLQGHQMHHPQHRDGPKIGLADRNTKKSGNPASNKALHKPHGIAHCSIPDDEDPGCLIGLARRELSGQDNSMKIEFEGATHGSPSSPNPNGQTIVLYQSSC